MYSAGISVVVVGSGVLPSGLSRYPYLGSSVFISETGFSSSYSASASLIFSCSCFSLSSVSSSGRACGVSGYLYAKFGYFGAIAGGEGRGVDDNSGGGNVDECLYS